MTTASGKPTRPQVTAQIDDVRERDIALEIAKLRGERDLLGRGLSVVIRRAVHDYVRRHYRQYRDRLPDHLQE